MGRRLRSQVADAAYPIAISRALRSELGDSHRAIKTVMSWTGASERSARNWLDGSSGPSGRHLVRLMRHSEAVTRAVLSLAGKNHFMPAVAVIGLRGKLLETVELIDSFAVADVVIHVPCARIN